MTNVSGTAEKISTRAHLFQIAVRALENEGWMVERISRIGKASVRRITKGKVSKKVSIRTSQDTWIAFPRNKTDTDWATLADVDFVVASSVDDRDNPKFAQVHMIDADDMRARYDRAYAARKAADYTMPVGRGIWLSLYDEEKDQPVTLVGAGAGLANPAIAKVPMIATTLDEQEEDDVESQEKAEATEAPLTIAEAKRRLAVTLGVSEADIKITITG
ncbi:hypothetical protein [Rhizobium sp. GCM10022189]|uniref:hypothetical protein n=1 Tax=Rhizobium sp. GCM10022189 TaxID=3252654 RepID=UPI00361C5E16